MSNQKIDPRVTTSLVGLGEDLVEGALNGCLSRAVVVMMDLNGEIEIRVAGCLLSDGIGMLNLASVLLVKKLVG